MRMWFLRTPGSDQPVSLPNFDPTNRQHMDALDLLYPMEKEDMTNWTNIYTDGACNVRTGLGGWGVVVVTKNEGIKFTDFGGHTATTNNRMELTAAIKALKYIPQGNTVTMIITDSKYVKDGIETWIGEWKKRGWRTASGKAVKNQDLWRELDDLNASRNPTWQWVKAHAGNMYNELADTLAKRGVRMVCPKP